jgi:restriction system protein
MRTIRVDDDVWNALQKRAKAFEDTPNSVLRRILRIDKNNKRKRRSAKVPRGQKTAQGAFRQPILQALYEAGGTARVSDVLDRVARLVERRLNEVDRQTLTTGSVRWRNTAQWERNTMVSDGLLKKSSPRGMWELTAKGIAAAESDANKNS